jgi:hypothetical protein
MKVRGQSKEIKGLPVLPVAFLFVRPATPLFCSYPPSHTARGAGNGPLGRKVVIQRRWKGVISDLLCIALGRWVFSMSFS